MMNTPPFEFTDTLLLEALGLQDMELMIMTTTRTMIKPRVLNNSGVFWAGGKLIQKGWMGSRQFITYFLFLQSCMNDDGTPT